VSPEAGPLAGIRILEVGTMLAGPYATMLLADLGAEVTKIEPPGGEISRGVSDSYFASLKSGEVNLGVCTLKCVILHKYR